MRYRRSTHRFHLTSRLVSVAVLALAAVLILGADISDPFNSVGAKRSEATNFSSNVRETVDVATPAASVTARRFNLTANDVVYDPKGGMLYASIPSTFGSTGNTLMQINPQTLTVGPPIFMGSEPGKMAVSAEGKYLYVALNGAKTVRRLNLATHLPEAPMWLGNKETQNAAVPTIEGPYHAADIAPMPGTPDTVAILSHGPTIYRDNLKLPQDLGPTDFFSTWGLTYSDSPSALYGYSQNGALLEYRVDNNGVSFVKQTSCSNLATAGVFTCGSGAYMVFAGGLIYTNSGLVIDPTVPKVVKTITFPVNTFAFVPDPLTGRMYVLGSSSGCGTCTHTAIIYAYDLNTFALIDAVEIPGVTGFPRSFIRWGSNGFAFRTNWFNGTASNFDELWVIRTSLVPSNDSIDLPTPTQPARNTPPTPQSTIRQVELPNNDLVYDATRRVIYASVPGFAGPMGNSIVAIDPSTGTFGNPVAVGPNPGKLAISRDDHYLYAANITPDLSQEKVRRLNLQSQTVDAEFSIRIPTPNPTGGGGSDPDPQYVTDMAVMPEDPTTVVLARARSLSGFQPVGIIVYKNGAAVAARFGSGLTTIETGDEPSIFYASGTQSVGGNAAQTYVKWQLGLPNMYDDPFGPVYQASGFVGGYLCDVNVSGGLLFDCGGRVANPTTLVPVGTFDLNGSLGRNVVFADTAAHRAYFLSGLDSMTGSTWTIRIFDTDTFLLLGSVSVPGVKGVAGSLVRWGNNGLAFGTGGNQVFLIQTGLIDSPIRPSPFVANVEGNGVVGGTGTISATLTFGGVPLSGRKITFSVNGTAVCGVNTVCPTTNAAGVATIPNVSLAGINAGTYGSGVRASFEGDVNYSPTSNTGSLTVAPVPQVLTDASGGLIAIDSVTFVREPFSIFSFHNLSSDQRTRVMIFTSRLGLNRPSADLSVTAGGIPLIVEGVGTLAEAPNISYIIVKLDPAVTGNISLTLTFHGVMSNAGMISISP